MSAGQHLLLAQHENTHYPYTGFPEGNFYTGLVPPARPYKHMVVRGPGSSLAWAFQPSNPLNQKSLAADLSDLLQWTPFNFPHPSHGHLRLAEA